MNNYILIISMHADPAMPPGYDEWGGTHTYMRELMECFEKQNINCILVTRKGLPHLPSVELYNSCCKVYRIQNGDCEPMSKQLLKNFHEQNLIEINHIINEQKERPRIIHSVYWNSGRLAMELNQQHQIPFVHSVISNARGRISRGAHEPLPERAEFEQKIYESANKILCVSNDERDDLVSFYNIDPAKIIVAGQYIDDAFITPAHDANGFPRLNTHIASYLHKNIAEKYNKAFEVCTNDLFWIYKVFTYFGRMDLNKGIDHILNAWYLLYQKYTVNCPPIWLVGGSVSEINQVRQSIIKHIKDLDEIEAMGKVIWWGYVDASGLSTILLKTSVLLMHSLYEPGGRVVVESMSEGIPVIATPNGFAKDIIIDWQNGFLTPYGDITKLAQRMEHFIRQPLLSDALGQNAKEVAENTRNSWAFIENHLSVYGMLDFENESNNTPTLNYFDKRKINLFPYYYKEISVKELKRILYQDITLKDIKKKQQIGTDHTSDIWELTSANGEKYILKKFFTRLSLGSLFNPLDVTTLVRQAKDCFRCEAAYYTKAESDILVSRYDSLQMLVLKELESFAFDGINSVSEVINHIILQPSILSKTDTELFKNIIQQPLNTIDDAVKLFKDLKTELKDYYFEHSGIFSNYVAWKIAPLLLDYNQHILQADVKELLHCFIKEFALPFEQNMLIEPCSINIDTECKHIMHDGEKIIMIDHEKVSIGMKEMDVAGFLYDYSNHFECSWPTILSLPELEMLNKAELICNIAYRYFYAAIINSVMGSTTEKQLHQLFQLKRCLHN